VRRPIAVIRYEGPESNPPAILVHGTFTWGAQSFTHQRPLAAHRRLLIPDRRGFGASPDLDGGDVTADYTVDALDVADLLGDGAHLVGHSYGGTVAMLAAADFAKLVIVGAWEAIPPGYRPGMAKVMQAVSSTVAERIGARLVRVDGAAHEPHREQPERVNALLAELWATSSSANEPWPPDTTSSPSATKPRT
jgi:pimeloyl-ACP methyl ester carboxylesterase